MENIRNLAAGGADPAPRPSGGGETEDYLKVLRNLIFFIAIYLYFTGWVYIYYYLDNFGISLSSLDTPLYFFFVYSYTVISDGKMWLGAVTAVAVVVLFLLQRYKRELVKKFVLTLLLAGLFPLSFYLAKSSGRRQAVLMRMGSAKPVRFVLKKDAQESYPEDFKLANEAESLKLIFQTEDRFYALQQDLGEAQVQSLPIGSTFVLFKGDVQTVRIDLIDMPPKER